MAIVLKKQAKPLEIVKPDWNVKYFRLLLFGSSGTGKTLLASTAADSPDMSPVLFLDSDRGLLTIMDREDIDVVVVTGYQAIVDVNKFVRANPDRYKTVVLDSLTSLQNQIIHGRLQEVDDRTEKEDPFVPSIRDYQHAVWRMRTILNMLKTAPIHFIATAQAARKEDLTEGIQRIMPALSSSLANDIGAQFDVVGYTYTRKKGNDISYYVQVESTTVREGKHRSPPGRRLPSKIKDPTVPALYRRILLGEEPEITESEPELEIEGAQE